MSALTAGDREKLIAILSLLASPFDGERQAAALAACRFLHHHDIGWSDVIGLPAQYSAASHNHSISWRQQAAECLMRTGSLRVWEIGFLRNIRASDRLSPKQRAVLQSIADRVLRRAA
jgi:hypothetical protein